MINHKIGQKFTAKVNEEKKMFILNHLRKALKTDNQSMVKRLSN